LKAVARDLRRHPDEVVDWRTAIQPESADDGAVVMPDRLRYCVVDLPGNVFAKTRDRLRLNADGLLEGQAADLVDLLRDLVGGGL